MKEFYIALQLWSVRNEMKADFKGTLTKVKELGYDGVEFAGLFGYSAAEVRKMCENIGIVPVSAHIPFAEMIANPEVIDDYENLGCEYIVSAGLSIDYRPANGRFGEVVEGVKRLSERAKGLGLRFAYHNHDYEFDRIDGDYALDILYREVPAELLDAQLDTCWVNVGGEDPAEYVSRYAGRVGTLHLKDFKGYRTEKTFAYAVADKNSRKNMQKGIELCTLGTGQQDFPSIIESAKSAGTKWLIVEQDEPSKGMTPIECAEKSINYLKSI